jgi:1-acyl-sn-glycerol-3-phosphate acyltransferase
MVLLIVSRMCARVKVAGAENIPAEGAFIFCANHIHSYDAVIVATSTKRTLAIMAKKELFDWWICRLFLNLMKAIPVQRGSADDFFPGHAHEGL